MAYLFVSITQTRYAGEAIKVAEHSFAGGQR